MQEQGWRMKKTAEIVANNIRVLRDILGLNHEQFSQRVQLPVERLKQMENAEGTLDNCIDILRIAQSCNVQYMDLFEDQTGKVDDSLVANAHVGKQVMDVIEAKRYKLRYKKGELCEKVGAHSSLWSKWANGEANPSVLSFNNLIAVLGLHYYDFNTVKDKAKEDVCINEEDVCINEEPDVDVEIVTERTVPADDFETRMLKVVRLQRKIDSYIEKLDEISNAIYSLRNELASMK